jgi:hypothetical protein
MNRVSIALAALLLSLGLWALPPAAPLALEAAPGTTVVYITATGTRYHRASCSYLSKSKIKTTLAEVRRKKLKACRKCNPPK